MKVKARTLGIIVFLVIFGSVGITSTLGLWKTTNDKIPATFTEGALAGQYNPSDIRGSYTFEDIQRTFKVPLEDLGIAFGLKDPSTYATFKCKDLETIFGTSAVDGKEVGTNSVRYFVALYKGLPITLEDTTYLPQSAVEILKAKAPLTQEQIQFLDTHGV